MDPTAGFGRDGNHYIRKGVYMRFVLGFLKLRNFQGIVTDIATVDAHGMFL